MKKSCYNANEVWSPKRTKLHKKECEFCSKEFSTYRISKKTCSKDCQMNLIRKKTRRGEIRECKKCGNPFYCRPSEDRRGFIRKYCSRQCKRKYTNRPDGLYISSDGYWCKSNGQKLHRYLFEQKFKIKLKQTDIIHHIDGDKLNNKISNLKKMSRTEHNLVHKFLAVSLT